MNDCTKRNCPFMNPSECMIMPLECPFYTNEANEKPEKTIDDIVSEIILRIKQCGAFDVLLEIKNQLGEMQTYKVFIDGEKYISRDEVLKLIDEKIKECSE